MALDDILAAITQETDRRIADAKEAQKKRLSDRRDESKASLARKKKEIDDQRQEKLAQMRAKAVTHFALEKRNAMLRKKRALLDACYNNVKLAALKAKPAAVEALLVRCLESIKEKGEIRPSKEHKALLEKIADKKLFTIGKTIDADGGFIFVSDAKEFDFTFDRLIEQELRPKTELEVSHSLFN